MVKIFGVRKEDEVYYQGAFWIVGDSVRDIKRGNFEIVGIQITSDYKGNYLEAIPSKSGLTHKSLWNRQFKWKINPKVDYDYYPRGRVFIHNGHVWINLHSLFNQPDVIDTVVEMYNLHKLDLDLDLKDTYQGSHYDFGLE